MMDRVPEHGKHIKSLLNKNGYLQSYLVALKEQIRVKRPSLSRTMGWKLVRRFGVWLGRCRLEPISLQDTIWYLRAEDIKFEFITRANSLTFSPLIQRGITMEYSTIIY